MLEKSVVWAGSSAHLGISHTQCLTGWKLIPGSLSWDNNSVLHVTVTVQLASTRCLHMVISAERGAVCQTLKLGSNTLLTFHSADQANGEAS